MNEHHPQPPFRVLLVDDEEKVLGALRRSISQIDPLIKLSVAHGGEDAIKASSEQNFDLVISDLRMPKTDGSRVLGFVRRNHPDSFRVILSGQANIESLLQALPVSHQYLEKPCQTLKLTGLIKTMNKLRKSKLPSALVHQILTISSFPCDGTIMSLLKEQIAYGISTNKLNILFLSDLSISIGLLRLTAITCGGKLPSRHPLDVANLTDDLLINLLDSALLVPLFQSEEILRALRLVSIKTSLLRQKLIEINVDNAKLLAVLAYLGELALVQSLGPHSNVLVRFSQYRDNVAELLWNVWAMPEQIFMELNNPKVMHARSQIDALFPADEMAQISNSEILEIYSEVICLTD